MRICSTPATWISIRLSAPPSIWSRSREFDRLLDAGPERLDRLLAVRQLEDRIFTSRMRSRSYHQIRQPRHAGVKTLQARRGRTASKQQHRFFRAVIERLRQIELA